MVNTMNPNVDNVQSVNGYTNEAFDPDQEIPNTSDPEAGVVQDAETEETAAIIHTKVEKLEPRDFASEIRPQLDIHHYFDSIQILLDTTANSPNVIVHQLIEKLFPSIPKKHILDTIEDVLYTDPEKTIFSEVIQGVGQESQGGTTISLEPTWFIALCKVPTVKRRFIGIARTQEPINFGPLVSAIKFFVLIIAPTTEKETKNATETGKTFATLFADPDLRLRLTLADTEDRFRNELKSAAIHRTKEVIHRERIDEVNWAFGTLLIENVVRRSKCYLSDITDGIIDVKSFLKTLSTTFFLYFSVILPCIAFGVLNKKNTGGNINESRALLGQVIGGLAWAFFAGQPMLIIATTALVALYSKVVYEISINLDEDFFTVYAWVGLWNTLFIFLYSIFGVSNLIRFSSRSPEEIFTIFITTCFAVDAVTSLVSTFNDCYRPKVNLTELLINETTSEDFHLVCDRSSCLLSLILVIGTVWLAVTIYNFKDSSYLVPMIREIISDYALPLSVILFSFIGIYCFQRVNLETLAEFDSKLELKPAKLSTSGAVIGASAALGFALSILLFMDENITAQIINAPTNRMKKGGAPHLDILMIGIINCVLSIYGLPWMHAVLPHSPLHVQCMADIEDRVSDGHIYKFIVKVRETRITGILCHVLIGVTLFYPPLFSFIPVSVLDGLFLYCAVASLRGSALYERLKLLITEQSQYPPIHYVRKCPQREMHIFTLLEMIQLAILAFVGFAPWPYLQMTFPAFIAILIPVRYFILPYFVDEKYVAALEEFH